MQRLVGSGVELRAGVPDLARQLAAGPLPGSRVLASELTLRMQTAGQAIAVSADDLRVINGTHSGAELAEAEVAVFQDYAANDVRVDMPPIRFTRAALRKFADHAIQGRSVKLDHGRTLVGATFAADVEETTVREVAAHWLRLRWYAVLNDQTSPERRQDVQDCRTGVRRFGSIGMFGGDWQFQEIEGPDGFEYFYDIDDDDSLWLREYSRVDLGAVAGAGDHQFQRSGERVPDFTAGGFVSPRSSTPPTAPQTLCVLS